MVNMLNGNQTYNKMSNISESKVIFFDWDGTLVDSLPFLHMSHNHVRKVMGQPEWTMNEYRQQMYRSSLDLYRDIYKERSDEALECLYTFYAKNHIKELSVIEGAYNFLDSLHQNGFVMGLVSNKKHQYLQSEVEHLGWNKFFAVIIGAGHAEKDKPDPAPLLMALRSTNNDACKEKVWYIGDTRTDIETAHKAGCASVLVLHGNDKEDIIKTHKPDMIFDNFEDLSYGILQNNKKNAC